MIAAHAPVAGAVIDRSHISYVYGLPSARFRDIVSGNNGASCLSGYDLVTGRGSWLG